MEEKILEIIQKNLVYDGVRIYTDNEHIAFEITSHVMEFIGWLNDNAEPRVGNLWAILSPDWVNFTKMSCEDAYQYWLKNVKDATN